MIRVHKHTLTVLLLAVILISGCKAAQQPVSPAVKPEPDEKISMSLDIIRTPDTFGETLIKTEYSSPSGRYFYYIEAQLSRREGELSKAIEYLKKAMAFDTESVWLQKELADLYLHQNDEQNALRIVEGIIQKHPDNIEAMIVYGRLKESLKMHQEAKEAYEKIIAQDPKQRDIYLILTNLYLESNDLSAALRVCQQFVQYFPELPAAHYYLGKVYVKQANYLEAEKEFKKTIELEPSIDEPRFELIRIYEIQNEKDKVIQLYEELLKGNPDNIRVSIEFARFCQKNHMRDRAGTLLKELGLRSLNDPEVLKQVVQLYITTQQYEDAIIILNEMLNEVPENADIHYILGVAYDGINDEPKAIAHFKQVTPNTRFFTNAAIHVAFLYQEKGQVREAIRFLKDVIAKAPDNAEFMLYLGAFYEEAQEFENAEKMFKQGIRLDPENSRIWFRLGVTYDKWGKKDFSIEAMKTVIRLDPKDANALNYLGYTWADLGVNLDEAERLIQEALKYKPDDGYIIDSLGWVHYKKGLYEKAIVSLEKAAELVKDDPTILEHLGDAYLQIGNTEKALDCYRRSLEKKDKDKEPLEKKIRELMNGKQTL